MTYDYTVNPPTATFNEYVKTKYLSLLKPMGEYTWKGKDWQGNDAQEKLYVYDLNELQKFTTNLMGWSMVSYDSGIGEGRVALEGEKNKIEEFTIEEIKLYIPFAFMLACVDSNAFSACVESYIPDAHNIILRNGWKQDELQSETLCATIIKASQEMKERQENRNVPVVIGNLEI